MSDLREAFVVALQLLAELDGPLWEIVALSLKVSLCALLPAALIGLPLGAAVALVPFWGRRAAVVALNALMGLPPVVVGLFVLMMLGREEPLGVFEWLWTPVAMVIAQSILLTPIVAALTRQIVEDLWEEYSEELRSLGAGPWRAIPTLLWDVRYRLPTVLLAGFGRAIAEVGAVMIVGGNIAHVTRVMTTAIMLETSKGDLALALGLGIVLLLMSLTVNVAAALAGGVARSLEA